MVVTSGVSLWQVLLVEGQKCVFLLQPSTFRVGTQALLHSSLELILIWLEVTQDLFYFT